MLREPTILSRMSDLIQGIKLLAIFKRLSKTQCEGYFSDQSQQEQTARWNQSEFLEISCNLLNAREESLVQVAIGFGFASHWLKNWRQGF